MRNQFIQRIEWKRSNAKFPFNNIRISPPITAALVIMFDSSSLQLLKRRKQRLEEISRSILQEIMYNRLLFHLNMQLYNIHSTSYICMDE